MKENKLLDVCELLVEKVEELKKALEHLKSLLNDLGV